MLKLSCLFVVLFVILSFSEENAPVAVITAIEGDVRICRYVSGECTTAVLESQIFLSDSLITSENSEVTVIYSDGKLASFGSNTGVKIVPPAGTIQRGDKTDEKTDEITSVLSPLFAFSAAGERTGVKILVRGEEDSLSLKIYQPGNTALSINKPDIIWSKFANELSYDIIIQKMGSVIWQKTSTDTFLKYPEDIPELAPGSYLLKVIALKGNDTLNSAERFFKVLKFEIVSEIEKALESIKKQNPDSFTLHFLSARIYEERGLVLDAIREYEQLIRIKPDEPLLHKSLSILYNKYGLIELGNKHLDQFEALTEKKK
ncbi:MAG: hypothetical protein ABIL22_01540 [candidate division WOR-3 bacterium]